ncbi:MAG: prepilin peptidase [Pseudomonadota bacterium]|nr:prepilin peptidase [Pseudomonadota bacterium]
MTADVAYWIFAAFAGVFGLLFGSFLNVCVARMPEDRSVVWPGSACPSCGTPIKPYDNVPVLAWMWLRGKCRACKGAISPLYPTVEALFGVLTFLLFRRVIPDLADLDTPHLAAFVWYGWFLFALVALTFIDLRHHIIPDEFSIYSVPVGIAGAALIGWLGYTGAPTWQGSVVGALVGGGGLAAISGLYWLVRREEGMGMGDVKLLAMFGAWFGGTAVVTILFLAACAGSVVGLAMMLVRRGGMRTALPFGPFLALAAAVWLYAGRVLEPYVTVRVGAMLELLAG